MPRSSIKRENFSFCPPLRVMAHFTGQSLLLFIQGTRPLLVVHVKSVGFPLFAGSSLKMHVPVAPGTGEGSPSSSDSESTSSESVSSGDGTSSESGIRCLP